MARKTNYKQMKQVYGHFNYSAKVRQAALQQKVNLAKTLVDDFRDGKNPFTKMEDT
jgi:hypothetical protein